MDKVGQMNRGAKTSGKPLVTTCMPECRGSRASFEPKLLNRRLYLNVRDMVFMGESAVLSYKPRLFIKCVLNWQLYVAECLLNIPPSL